MAILKELPSQTAGPYVHIGCAPSSAGLANIYGGDELGSKMIKIPTNHQEIDLTGKIYDANGDVIKDALVEIWQAAPDGTFNQTDYFTNWGRQSTDNETGFFKFETLMPGMVENQAPHVFLWIAARGINLALATRIYFEDNDILNKRDPILGLAGARAKTLIATKSKTGYHHEIHIQGPNETVFFNV